jgi:CII-binding regulator of phage lambda lysogenization HflD
LIESKNSKLITEGAFSNLWNTLQEKGMSVINKLVQAIKDFIQKVMEKISGAITDLLSILGFEIQILGDYDLDASVTYESV